MPVPLRLLRVTGGALAAASLFSAVSAAVMVAGVMAEGGSMGTVVLFLSGLLQSVWQCLAGVALSALCFAAARLLEWGDPRDGISPGVRLRSGQSTEANRGAD